MPGAKLNFARAKTNFARAGQIWVGGKSQHWQKHCKVQNDLPFTFKKFGDMQQNLQSP